MVELLLSSLLVLLVLFFRWQESRRPQVVFIVLQMRGMDEFSAALAWARQEIVRLVGLPPELLEEPEFPSAAHYGIPNQIGNERRGE